jgi:hypothetical protein
LEGGERKVGMREAAPKITGFLGRGSFVSVSARIGNDLSGYVCDRDRSGLLLDVRGLSDWRELDSGFTNVLAI